MPRRFTLLAALAFLVLAPAALHAETYPTRRITAVIPFPAGSGTDPVARFVGERVSKALKQPFVLLVRPEVPAASVREFIDHAKAHPGKLNYGTGNTGGLAATQMLKTMTGVDVVQVSYRGTPQAVTDLLGGRLHFMFTDPALVREHVEKGSLRALAVTSAERMSAFPDLPTMAESSLPKFEIVSWIAVFAPAGTPEAILATLNRELVAAIRDPEAGEFFRKLAMEPSPTTPAELAGFVESEIRKWGEVIAAAGLEKQ
jgi:tripartite-type tricarboxylate transporter receptor subunit TctC